MCECRLVSKKKKKKINKATILKTYISAEIQTLQAWKRTKNIDDNEWFGPDNSRVGGKNWVKGKSGQK